MKNDSAYWRTRLNPWERVWVVFSALVLVIFTILTVSLLPDKSYIIFNWLYETIDVVKEPGEGPFRIRHAYKNYGDREAIDKIHDEYIKKDPTTKISFDRIDNGYRNELASVPYQQLKLVLTALTIYLCLISLIYALGWSIGLIYRGFKTEDRRLLR